MLIKTGVFFLILLYIFLSCNRRDFNNDDSEWVQHYEDGKIQYYIQKRNQDQDSIVHGYYKNGQLMLYFHVLDLLHLTGQ